MPRLLTPLAIALALVSAFMLYAIKYDTRTVEARVQANERAIDKATSDIAVLRAERAHLARPDRIEPLARALGLAPPAARQIVRPEVRPGAAVAPGAQAAPASSSGGRVK